MNFWNCLFVPLRSIAGGMPDERAKQSIRSAQVAEVEI
jgi:hypothetical protein